MSDIPHQKLLLSLNGVSKKDLPALKLSRFLLHDKPFAVFEHIDKNMLLHLKLTKSKIKEIFAHFNNLIQASALYNSSRWVSMQVSSFTLKQLETFLLDSYKITLSEVPINSRRVYIDKDPASYDINFFKQMAQSKIFPHIEFAKKVMEL